MAPGLDCATKKTQNLKGFPGSVGRPGLLFAAPQTVTRKARPGAPGAALGARSLRFSRTPPSPRSPILGAQTHSRPTQRDPACGSSPRGPPALPSPEGVSEPPQGSGTRAGLRSRTPHPPPHRLRQAGVGGSQNGHPRPAQARARDGAAQPAGWRQTQGQAPGKLPPEVPNLGRCAALSGALGPSDRSLYRQTADSLSPPRVLPPGVPARGPPARPPSS